LAGNQSRLERIQSIASIASSIAIPLVLAVAGYFVQRQISDDGIKKDYVSIATGILRDKSDGQDPALRDWAVTVLAKYSPVTFSAEAKDGLGRGLPVQLFSTDLPALARQKKQDPLCSPTCSGSLSSLLKDLRGRLENESDSPVGPKSAVRAARLFKESLDTSINLNLELASALDHARISGKTCEAFYDSYHDLNIKSAP
jgi:hypothetical protein